MAVNVRLPAEFDFTERAFAQRQKIQRLQYLLIAPVAGFVFLLSEDVIYGGLLELVLLLVFCRARRGVAMADVVERLVISSKSGKAIINGRAHALSACGIAYSSTWLTLISLSTAAKSYRCWVSPGLLGSEKYRQLIALLKAKPL
ncbi:MAG: hypothetical protein JKX92_10005 [Porticoccaceae bacterium]|nr:hypothetical protein [Porticoccaceae bacterium]